MAFHNYRGSVRGIVEGFEDDYFFGRNPTSPIIANYRNLHKQDTDFLEGTLRLFIQVGLPPTITNHWKVSVRRLRKKLQNQGFGVRECIQGKPFQKKAII